MKIKSIVIGLAIALMSTRCPDKPVPVYFENKSNKDIVFSYTKNIDTLTHILKEMYSYDLRVKEMNRYHISPPIKIKFSELSFNSPCFKYLKNNSIKKDTLGESDLYYYYLPKNKNYYTFYFLRVIKFDTIKDNYVFEKRYDSINVDKDKILIGDEGRNIFTYGDKWLVFTAKENN